MLGLRRAGIVLNERLSGEDRSYASVDSVQPGFAVKRTPWVAPAFLLAFAGLSYLAVSVERDAYDAYRGFLESYFGAVIVRHPGENLGLRPFFLLLALLLPAFSAAPVIPRAMLILRFVAVALVTMVLVDALLLKTAGLVGASPFEVQGQVVSGLLVLAALTVTMLKSYNFPANNSVPTLQRRPRRYLVVFLIVFSMSVAVVVVALSFGRTNIDALRNLGIIGGIAPGVALFAPSFSIFRFCAAWIMFRSEGSFLRVLSFGKVNQPHLQRWLDEVVAGRVRAPRIAFLVPAHNESENIRETILSMDRAATRYPGDCRVVIVDNNSTDQTLAVAERALRQCEYLTGQVLECPAPGKSKALNMGVDHLEAEIMVRVDADTVIEDDCLSKIAMHFSDPEVGGVGGLPLPLNNSGWFSRVRKVEVYHNVAWTRLGQMATDSVLVVPGMLSAFRTHLVKELGGFVEGINGEDMDMTVRVGRSGYRIVVDPDIVFRTEVPADIAHMREQRLRWSRGVFHVFTRNISSFWLRQGVRGMWVMPLAAFGSWRRALVPLLIVYAAVAAVASPGMLDLRQGATFAAIIFGPEVLVTLLAVTAFRQFRLILVIPAYFLFRLFRAYIGMEMMLSLHQKVARRREMVDLRQQVEATQTPA